GEIGSPSTVFDNPQILSINSGNSSNLQGQAGFPNCPKFVIDGIKFINGQSSKTSTGGVGGGAISYYGGHFDTIEIENCLFTNNRGSSGGAFYFSRWVSSAGHTLVNIHGCTFDQNIGYYYGGAIGTRPMDTLFTHGIISS
ncbi:MAG: hypothetical protein JST06_05475, partial [Bacteroidetes bacterium]|nr:hypothetical protein [Bacteroidota bacterium]